jgi:hypothetical protein
MDGGADTAREAGEADTPGDGRWQRAFEVAALLLLVGVAVSAIGAAVSAGGAPQIGVIDDWGRIDEFASRVAGWEYVLAVAVAALLVVPTWSGSGSAVGPSRRSRLVLFGVLAELSVVAVTAGLGIAAVYSRSTDTSELGGVGTTRYYTSTEQLGETIVYAGVMLAIAGLAWGVLHLTGRVGRDDPA